MNKVAKMMLMNRGNTGKDSYQNTERGDFRGQYRSGMDYDRAGRMDYNWEHDHDYGQRYGREGDRMERGSRQADRYSRDPRRQEMESWSGRGDDDEWHQAAEAAGMPDLDKALDMETTRHWMERLQNADGSRGPHWSMDQTKQLMAQKNVDCDPLEFWAAMNMMFSDYAPVAKKHNASTVDFYVEMAKAFLDDKDAKGNKLGRYYWAVVK